MINSCAVVYEYLHKDCLSIYIYLLLVEQIIFTLDNKPDMMYLPVPYTWENHLLLCTY